MTQLKSTSHKKTKPQSAPSDVVRISSPDPTMLPARTIPGPILNRAFHRLAGGGWIAASVTAYGSSGVCFSLVLMPPLAGLPTGRRVATIVEQGTGDL